MNANRGTGGAENFCSPEAGGETYNDLDYYNVFSEAGYSLVSNNTELQATSDSERTLGIFSTGNMEKWLDRNVYTDNLVGTESSPDCLGTDPMDQPGLKEMTLKAIDILDARAKADGDKGWFLMAEAASIDKQMHSLDYDRALGELLELDDTIKASIEHLKKMGELENTLIVVTADHGHGFDVFGGYDTKYGNAQTDDRSKRNAVGVYEQSGQSQYTRTGDLRYSDSFFPSNWDPRYTLAQGFGAHPDIRENYEVHRDGPRTPAKNVTGFPSNDYFVNPTDNPNGFISNGTLPTSANQGVHSLTDVPVFAQGPCQELFGGVYNSIDIFYHMAECLGLSRTSDDEDAGKGPGGYGGHGKGQGNDKHHGRPGYKHYGPKQPFYKKKHNPPQ
jgi:alkaline phosphatase